MKAQQDLRTRLALTIASVLLAMASLLLVSPSRAEILSHYEPGVLLQAEQALERGQPERALSLLHSQRAILSHGKFREQGQAIACQAYIQKQDLAKAEQACDETVAFSGRKTIAGAYAPSVD